MKSVVTGSLAACLAVSLLGNVLIYLRYSANRPLVTVGGQTISKRDYQEALDNETQGAVLKKMVLADLIDQAAVKAQAMPSDTDVEARIADVQRRDPQALPTDKVKMADFLAALRTAMALENLRVQDVTVTDAQVAAYYNQHQEDFALPKQVQTKMVLADSAADAARATSLLQQNVGIDVITQNPHLHVLGQNGFTVNWETMPPALNKKVSSIVLQMHQGDVQSIPFGKYILVVRAAKSAAHTVPTLDQIRPEVTRLVKLQMATPVPVEIARLYQAASPQFAVAKYADYFTDLSRVDTAHGSPAKKTASLP